MLVRWRQMRLPDGSAYFVVAGVCSVAYWFVGTVVGKHPDGGLLGFSAGMFAVWSAMRKDSQRRDNHRHRHSHERKHEEWREEDPEQDDQDDREEE